MPNFKRYFQNNDMVFITIVTFNRQNILIDNIDILRKALTTPKYNYKIIAGVVLPDHLHMIIQPENARDLPKIIASFKANFSKSFPINDLQTSAQKERREKGIWQRRYYDHIIRNEKDFNQHIDYIHYNPVKHLGIKPYEWKYSSFKTFVKQGFYEIDWCNIGDKNGINNLDFE